MFFLLIWGSPIYTTWNSWLLSCGVNSNANSKGWHVSDGVLFLESVAGQQWMRPSPALSWPLPSGGGLTFKQHQPSLRRRWAKAVKKMWKALRGLRWNRQRKRGLNRWAADGTAPGAKRVGKTWESRQFFQQPQPGFWATSFFQELRTHSMQLALLLQS